MKKFLIITAATVVFLAAAAVFAASIIQRKAPDFLRAAIEKSLNKKVAIRDIAYHFPRSFELQGFEIREKGEPFNGEASFYVDHVTLNLSPLIFSKKALIITELEAEDADIVIRKLHGKLYHALSGVLSESTGAGAAAKDGSAAKKTASSGLPLEIRLFTLKNCHFQFTDYDVQKSGFVMSLDKINARIKNIKVPSAGQKTFYEIDAELLQERDQRNAKINVSGWTAFDTMDTDAAISMTGVHLPYFRPYYAQVTGAAIEDGYTDLHATMNMDRRVLDLNMGFELSGLLFESYEGGDRLFGLKADEVLSFLKDSSGRLKFEIMVKWDTSDKSVKLRDVFRQSIERSLRQTVLGNVGNILMNALQKANDSSVGPGKKASVEDKIKKIKDFFKY